MDELPTQPAILVLSSGFHDDLLPSPFSGRGKKQLTSAFQGVQWNEAFDESIYALSPLNPECFAAHAPAPGTQGLLAWAHYPDPTARCWLGQSSTAVIRCWFQFLSLERSGQTFPVLFKSCISLFGWIGFFLVFVLFCFLFFQISENHLDWSLSQTIVNLRDFNPFAFISSCFIIAMPSAEALKVFLHRKWAEFRGEAFSVTFVLSV